MWKTASERAGGTAVSRACSSTLVALAGDLGSELDPLVQAISRRHPCRVIRVERVPGGDAPLEASAGAVCHLRPGGEGLICGEEIRIGVREEASRLLPSAVRSLAVGGLPLVLFAPEPVSRRRGAFRALAADADMAVVESRGPEDLEMESPIPVRDLAWSRGGELRRAVALAADACPECTTESVEEIRIEHGGGGAVPASAILVAAWIVSRLGLTLAPSPAKGRTLALQAAGRPDAARLAFRSSPGPTDAAGVVLRTTEGANIEARLSSDGGTAQLAGPGIEREIVLRRRSVAEMVIDEIHGHGPDPSFEAAMPIAREICRGPREETG